jgi:hypothetical protein
MSPKALLILNLAQAPLSLLGVVFLVGLGVTAVDHVEDSATNAVIASVRRAPPPQAPKPEPQPAVEEPAPVPVVELSTPQVPAGRPVSVKCFQILQVISPGRALAINAAHAICAPPAIAAQLTTPPPDTIVVAGNTPGQFFGDGRTYLLVGAPKTLVDSDTWVGSVFDGDAYSYETAGGSTATVRTLIVAAGGRRNSQ